MMVVTYLFSENAKVATAIAERFMYVMKKVCLTYNWESVLTFSFSMLEALQRAT